MQKGKLHLAVSPLLPQTPNSLFQPSSQAPTPLHTGIATLIVIIRSSNFHILIPSLAASQHDWIILR